MLGQPPDGYDTIKKEEHMMIFEKLAAMIAEHLECEAGTITADTTFDGLGVDSLDMVEMVMRIEEDLGIEVEMTEKLATVGELAKFIESKM